MKVSYNWLKSIIPFDWTVEDLAEKLTMSGTEVEYIDKFGGKLDGVVTAEVESVERHPDADKLSVCRVFDGHERYQVVCGAPNVAGGQKVMLAKVGAVLPGGMVIKKAKLRGIQSSGMICSFAELNLGEDASGIAVLPDDAAIGLPVTDLFGPEDSVLEMEITPNRPDCLSHLGIAREIQALGGGALPAFRIDVSESGGDIAGDVIVEINNPDDCPRYAARVIKNVEIKPSPSWLVARLHAIDIRSINNVVDVTNYVMMEYGHPLHAFDFDLFSDPGMGTHRKVVVRGSRSGEKFVTLDDVERELPEGSILITDGVKPIALGGIMGGANSEVSDGTTNILLESAYFNPVRIRRTAKAVKLSTESSQRFERGTDCENLTSALDRAAQLMHELAGGEIARGIADCYPNKYQYKKILLKSSEVERILGEKIDINKSRRILESLGMETESGNENSLMVTAPSFRPDLTRPADLIEEIARIYGFDTLPTSEILAGDMEVSLPASFRISRPIRDYFTSSGFDEVVNWVLYDPKKYDRMSFRYDPVIISNPLSEDSSLLRPHLWGSLLDDIRYNLNRNIDDVRIFEVDYIFNSNGRGKLPGQGLHVSIGWTGNAHKPGWDVPPRKVDLFDLKGLMADFFRFLNICNTGFKKANNMGVNSNPFLDQEYTLNILLEDKVIGQLGKVSNKAREIFDMKAEIWLVDIDLGLMMNRIGVKRYFKEPPKFPPSDRDLAVVVDKALPVGDLIESIKEINEALLENVQLFDIYSGKQIPEGKKSLALSLRFRHLERTLTDNEVDKALDSIIKHIKSKYELDLRA